MTEEIRDPRRDPAYDASQALAHLRNIDLHDGDLDASDREIIYDVVEQLGDLSVLYEP